MKRVLLFMILVASLACNAQQAKTMGYWGLTSAGSPVILSFDSLKSAGFNALLWKQTSPVTITNSITETSAIGTGNGSLTIPATPVTGTTYRIYARGYYSTQAVISPTLTINVYLGGVKIATGTVSSFLISSANKLFYMAIDFQVTAANTLYAQGGFYYYGATTELMYVAPMSLTSMASATVNLAQSNALTITYTWGTAASTNTITTKTVTFEQLN